MTTKKALHKHKSLDEESSLIIQAFTNSVRLHFFHILIGIYYRFQLSPNSMMNLLQLKRMK
ncbi:hypothetical protein JCM9152_1732 [Halalkalibacter hemicellulosilyticusJCM 9152]|uniref:Uncharacterized protein n=1 Tax=Halalkalibacter hemicellulosilyticusJCM 9152 TaxID=1236971 RepID=W4QF98_9BACI|nr:hypothetical protein JCM9152_1732 [Halalkalibacter hemicellulosilyticusJCM 9152]